MMDVGDLVKCELDIYGCVEELIEAVDVDGCADVVVEHNNCWDVVMQQV